MGGRGSSSIAAAPARMPTPPAPQPAPPQAPPTPTTPSGKTLADVQKMDDKQLHDFLIDVNNTDIPDFLNNTHLQKMTYALGLNDPPEQVSQKEFDDMVKNGATVLYRTVNDTTLQGGVKLTSNQVAQTILYGDVSYQGNGVHGDGLYFSDNRAGSLMYGRGGGRSSMVTVALNKNARAITENNLRKEYDAYVASHPQTRRALGFAKRNSYHDSMSQFALIRGYNVITYKNWNGETYYTVLDRKALSTAGKITRH